MEWFENSANLSCENWTRLFYFIALAAILCNEAEYVGDMHN
jgi:hypothetical protein